MSKALTKVQMSAVIRELEIEKESILKENEVLKTHQKYVSPELSEREKRAGMMRATFWYGAPTKAQINKGNTDVINLGVALDWEGKIVATGMCGFIENGMYKPPIKPVKDKDGNITGWMKYFDMCSEIKEKVIAKAKELQKLGNLKREYPKKFHGFNPASDRKVKPFNQEEEFFHKGPGGVL